MNDEQKKALALGWYNGQVTLSLFILLLCGLFGFSFIQFSNFYDFSWCVSLFLIWAALSAGWLCRVKLWGHKLLPLLFFKVGVHAISVILILYPVCKWALLTLSTEFAVASLICLIAILKWRALIRVERIQAAVSSAINDGRISLTNNLDDAKPEVTINPLVKSAFDYQGTSEERERLERNARLVLGTAMPIIVVFAALLMTWPGSFFAL